MKSAHLKDMIGGWLVGNFEPSVARTEDFEFGIKRYEAGDIDAAHYHKLATEITVIISGQAVMGDKEWSEGDVIVVEPGDVVQFRALSDVVLAVIKMPSVPNDKYLV
ncbi:hypothetical protein [Methylobacterium mesophilicum]|uniref:cupin domain-containing protein n=1 Tax=Methylobacterium mesophilicum TaxID=39956 RepID=UPI002F2CE93D